jgi:large conductance mechanosensitive channel
MKVPMDLPHLPKVKVKVKIPTLLEEFKAFALKGNIVDLAVAVVIGGAFNGVVQSLVKDIIMPAVHKVSPSQTSWNQWTIFGDEKTGILIGHFLGEIVNFVIIAFAVFLIMVKFLTVLRKTVIEEEVAAPTTKECPMCISTIPIKARKCPQCTADLPDSGATPAGQPAVV